MNRFKSMVAGIAVGATTAGFGMNALAADIQFQLTGVDAIYNPAEDYIDLGIANPQTGDFPVLRDQNKQGSQEFGDYDNGDPLIEIEILVNGSLYGTLDTNIAVDFRLVLAENLFGLDALGTPVVGPTGTDGFDWSLIQQVVAIDTDRSFFDVLLFNNDPGNPNAPGVVDWGIALDTAQVTQVANQAGGLATNRAITAVLGGGLCDVADCIVPYLLPPTTAEGLPLDGIIGEGDTFSFSLSLGSVSILPGGDENCDPDNVTTGAVCNGEVLAAEGTGEINWEGEFVSEPATVLMLGLGLTALGVSAASRRRRKA